MKTKNTFSIILLFLSFIATAQEKSKFTPQLDKVLEMFQKQDASIATPVLHENYIISNILPGMEEQILPQVLGQMPAFGSYEIESEKAETNGTRIELAFVGKEEGIRYPCTFLIDKNGKIAELNILENAEIKTELNKQ